MENVLNILLVDDDEDDQLLFKEALDEITKKPFHLISLYNGIQAIDYLSHTSSQRVRPDFVVLDLNMPKLDGFATLEKIKASERTSNLPVYILTTSWTEVHMKKCKSLGANGYFTKPSSLQLLAASIQKMISDLDRSGWVT